MSIQGGSSEEHGSQQPPSLLGFGKCFCVSLLLLFAVCCFASNTLVSAGYYDLDSWQMSGSPTASYSYKLYSGTQQMGQPIQWTLVTTQQLALTGSYPEYGYYIYEISVDFYPANGNQFDNVTAVVVDNDNLIDVDEGTPPWNP